MEVKTFFFTLRYAWSFEICGSVTTQTPIQNSPYISLLRLPSLLFGVIARIKKGINLCNPCTHHDSFKPCSLRNSPGCHKTSVIPPGDTKAIRISNSLLHRSQLLSGYHPSPFSLSPILVLANHNPRSGPPRGLGKKRTIPCY